MGLINRITISKKAFIKTRRVMSYFVAKNTPDRNGYVKLSFTATVIIVTLKDGLTL